VSPQTQTVSINSPTNLVTVQNSYQCQGGVGTLVVKKIVTGTLSPQPTTSFGINVSCQGSTAWALNLANGGSSSLSPISIGKTCTITEPTLPPPFQAAGKTCTWHHVPATQTVPINGPSQIVVVNNSYTCV
jgi:hypothetical protein